METLNNLRRVNIIFRVDVPRCKSICISKRMMLQNILRILRIYVSTCFPKLLILLLKFWFFLAGGYCFLITGTFAWQNNVYYKTPVYDRFRKARQNFLDKYARRELTGAFIPLEPGMTFWERNNFVIWKKKFKRIYFSCAPRGSSWKKYVQTLQSLVSGGSGVAKLPFQTLFRLPEFSIKSYWVMLASASIQSRWRISVVFGG